MSNGSFLTVDCQSDRKIFAMLFLVAFRLCVSGVRFENMQVRKAPKLASVDLVRWLARLPRSRLALRGRCEMRTSTFDYDSPMSSVFHHRLQQHCLDFIIVYAKLIRRMQSALKMRCDDML
jgi:hypothetical protein